MPTVEEQIKIEKEKRKAKEEEEARLIRNESMNYIRNVSFHDWLEQVRLNGEERDEIEDIIRDLCNLIDY